MGICYWLMCVPVYQFTNSSFFLSLPLHSLNLFKYFPSSLKNTVPSTLHHFAFRHHTEHDALWSLRLMILQTQFMVSHDSSNFLQIGPFQHDSNNITSSNLILQFSSNRPFFPNYSSNIMHRNVWTWCPNRNVRNVQNVRIKISKLLAPTPQTEPHGSQAPRMTYFTSSVVQRQMGEQVEIGCAAQAFPLPQFRYRTPFI